MLSGSASPAELHRRSDSFEASGNASPASIAANSVGTPEKTVGRCATRRAATAAGVARSAISTAVAPTDSGKVSELPRP